MFFEGNSYCAALSCCLLLLLCVPCSDRDSNVPFLRNHWPSMLPVTENAQQDPHIPCQTNTNTLIGLIGCVTCYLGYLLWHRLLVPDSSRDWQLHDPANPSCQGRGPWREWLVSLAYGESTDSGEGSGTWSETLPLKRKKLKSRRKECFQRWAGEDMQTGSCISSFEMVQVHTRTHQLGRWTWWLRIQLNLDLETGAFQPSSGSRERSANVGLSLQQKWFRTLTPASFLFSQTTSQPLSIPHCHYEYAVTVKVFHLVSQKRDILAIQCVWYVPPFTFLAAVDLVVFHHEFFESTQHLHRLLPDRRSVSPHRINRDLILNLKFTMIATVYVRAT